MTTQLTGPGWLTLHAPLLALPLERLSRCIAACADVASETRAAMRAAHARYPFVDW